MPSFRAYAKINLGLRILDTRPDGYHNIETVFHRVNVYDTITLGPGRDLVVESTSPAAPGNAQNLCFKAAKLLQNHLGVHSGVTISLQKSIPVGAGLGGGSADAAIILLHLPDFWDRSVDQDSLLRMALELGSDVPYFLKPGSAFARGRGEILSYFDLDVPYTILLCHPGISISTAWAYRNVKPRSRSTDLKNLVECGMQDRQRLAELTNDFEEPVFQAYPAIKSVKEIMLVNGAVFSSLSGSGSTVYGLYDDEQQAQKTSSVLASMGHQTYLSVPGFSAVQ